MYLGWRLAQGKSREGWAERWGRLPARLTEKRGPRIWVHAASVGEVVAATPILRAYRDRNPGHELVLSVITPGGREVASKLVGTLVDAVFYSPFDLPLAVRRTVAAVRADVFVGLETELWPNLLHHVKQSGARTVLVNGRISDRSFPAYRRLRFFFGWTLRQFDRLMAQTERDARRLGEIGADPAVVSVSGNSKFDQATERLTPEEAARLRTDLRMPQDIPVWVVGSTRTAAEERKVFAAYRRAREALPELGLIHAPRHVDRADEVIAAMRAAGFNPVRRTEVSEAPGPVTQIVLDTFGELARMYAVGDAAFIGNSLTAPGGGQNLLQPLAQGKPVLYGLHMSNFRDLCALAEDAGVGFRVAEEHELASRLVALIRDEGQRAPLAARAHALIEANRGASARYAEAIAELACGSAGGPPLRDARGKQHVAV